MEAGQSVPLGAPYIGSPGDMVCPTIHYLCTLYIVADWGLVSTISVWPWHVLSVLGATPLSLSSVSHAAGHVALSPACLSLVVDLVAVPILLPRIGLLVVA
jgi:hypothetical protein